MVRMSDSPKGRKFDGVRAVAEMLNHMEGPDRERLIAGVARENPDLARRIQDSMFVFEDLGRLDSRSMQVLLKEVPRPLLLVALRRVSDELRSRVMGSLSMRMREELSEELAAQPPRKLSEVEAAQKKIVEMARRLELEGRLVLDAPSPASSPDSSDDPPEGA